MSPLPCNEAGTLNDRIYVVAFDSAPNASLLGRWFARKPAACGVSRSPLGQKRKSEIDKIIAIGDIHGCLPQLEEILHLIRQYSDHELVFLGDYIDRGPDSEAVCQRLMGIDAIFLRGNHEEMLENRIKQFPNQRPETLSISGLSEKTLLWIETELRNIFSTKDYIFVHAGLDIGKSLDQQSQHDYLWTHYKGNYSALTNKTVVHGHVIVKEPAVVGNRININTGCGNGGRLTAIILPEMLFLNSSISTGSEYDWVRIRKELEADIIELEAEKRS